MRPPPPTQGLLGAFLLALPLDSPAPAAAPPDSAREEAAAIIDRADFKGGLIVHVARNQQDANLTAAIADGPARIVHVLCEDAALVGHMRERFDALGLAGRVTAGHLRSSQLPLVDDAVSLFVSGDPCPASQEEILRALSPRGVACIWRDGKWATTVKPWPDDIDEWTHYLHGPGGNPVSRDRRIGPPAHLQWVGGPEYLRHHDHMSGLSAMVSARGRLYYIMDLGPRWSVQMPSEWTLIARDAFNGVILWQRPIDKWHPHLWPLKRGPSQVLRRLIAEGDRIYVTLGVGSPVSVIDGATGSDIATLQETAGTEEMILSDGILFAVANPDLDAYRDMPTESVEAIRSAGRDWNWDEKPRRIVAIDAATGRQLWHHESPVAPGALAAANGRLCFHDGDRLTCLGARDGKRLWASEPLPRWKPMHVLFAPSLVLHEDVVLFAGGEAMDPIRGGKDTMTALDAASGKKLWSAPHPESGYASAEDLMVIDDLVWCGATTSTRSTGILTGREPRTGEVRAEFPPDDWQPHMSHHRCYRAKATCNYILMSRTGIEFIDLNAKHWVPHHWVRGSCNYGILPANGFVYAPPHSCACYLLAKLNGINALATASPSRALPKTIPEEGRLEKGPAGQVIGHLPSAIENGEDWPTLRGNPARSGFTPSEIPQDLKLGWRTTIGGRLSSPVIAEGKVFVASVDRGALHAIDAGSGATDWRFIAGGRVDSPPTIWRGRALFGCADGHVYCLRAKDGSLLWRFRAAPIDRRHVANEHLESIWPVSGSVLVREQGTASGKPEVWCVAGRSMWLDGGMRLLRLDPESGAAISETVLDDRIPGSNDNLQKDVKWPNLPVALPDVLSFDGRLVYMRSQPFHPDGTRTGVITPRDHTEQQGDTAHIFSPTGFLDDSWWHRTYWMYGQSYVSGAGGWSLAAEQAPAGRILCVDGTSIFGFGRAPLQFRGTPNAYHLFSCPKQPKRVTAGRKPQKKHTPATLGDITPTRIEYDWSHTIPFLARAMVLAADTLFVAGPPVPSDESEPYLRYGEAEIQRALRDAMDAFEGRKGSLLMALSKRDGSRRSAFRLPSAPVFDGLAAAYGALFLTMLDGTVVRLGPKGAPLDAAPDLKIEALKAPEKPTGFSPTASHPDFNHIADAQITPCELGYHITAAKGKTAFAIRELPAPLTKITTFTVRIRPRPGQPAGSPGNGFLVFGDSPSDRDLVKCGFRISGQSLYILQGAGAGKGPTVKVPVTANEVTEMCVIADLDAQKIIAAIGDHAVEAPLQRPLKAITWLGYSVATVDAEFGPIDIKRAQ